MGFENWTRFLKETLKDKYKSEVTPPPNTAQQLEVIPSEQGTKSQRSI